MANDFLEIQDRLRGDDMYRVYTMKLPRVFYHDHRERDLPEEGTSRIVRETQRWVLVEMDGPALADLRSDAAYYTDPSTASQMGMPGLASSARATLRAIDKQLQTPA